MAIASASPYSASALLPPLARPGPNVSIAASLLSSAEEHAAAKARYLAETDAYDRGWAAALSGQRPEDNPHFSGQPDRIAWSWACGFEEAHDFKRRAGSAVNWLRQGQKIRILRYDRLDQRKFAGRVGTIEKIGRRSAFGTIVVTIPPQGRQRITRNAIFDLDKLHDIEPIDDNV